MAQELGVPHTLDSAAEVIIKALTESDQVDTAEAVAEEQRRITALLQAEVARYPETIGEGREGWALFARQCGVEDALNLVRAAGSVPVATPTVHGSRTVNQGAVATPVAPHARREVKCWCFGNPTVSHRRGIDGCRFAAGGDFAALSADPDSAAEPSVGTGTPAEAPTFDQLLSDPLEQFDRRSELLPAILRHLCSPDVGAFMRSIEEYRNAPPAAATTAHMFTPTATSAPAEAVSGGGSGHAELPDDGNLRALLQRYVSNPAIRQRMLGEVERLTAEVARCRPAISELHAIMDAAIVRGGYRPGESERVEALLAAALGDGE